MIQNLFQQIVEEEEMPFAVFGAFNAIHTLKWKFTLPIVGAQIKA